MKIILKHDNAVINWDNVIYISPNLSDSDLFIHLKDGYTISIQCDSSHKVLKEIMEIIEYEISMDSHKNVVIIDLEEIAHSNEEN